MWNQVIQWSDEKINRLTANQSGLDWVTGIKLSPSDFPQEGGTSLFPSSGRLFKKSGVSFCWPQSPRGGKFGRILTGPGFQARKPLLGGGGGPYSHNRKFSFDFLNFSGGVGGAYTSVSLIIALVLLGLGFAVLLHGLAADGLWGDEIFTAIFAAKSPWETIQFTASDIHPPLYYLLAGALSHTPLWSSGVPGPVTDWFWRWPSVLAGLLTIAVTFRLGKAWFTPRVGLMAALLVMLAPVVVKYSQEARMHALFMMLSVLTTLLLTLARQTGRRKYWLGYTAATVLNLYTMYFAFLVIIAQGLWMLAAHYHGFRFSTPWGKNRNRVGRWFQLWRQTSLYPFTFALIAAGLAYLPWWPTLIGILSYRAQVGAVEGGVGSPGAFLPKAIQSIGPFGGGAWLFLGLYLTGLWAARRRHGSLPVLGALWVVLPLLLPMLLGDSRARQVRYAFILPVYLIFVALAVNYLAAQVKSSWRRSIQLLLTGVLVALSFGGVLRIYAFQKPDWRGAAAFVATQAHPLDVIVTGPLWDDFRFFSYYYPPTDRIMPPPTLAFKLPGIAAEMATDKGRLWLVTRYPPEIKGFESIEFYGVTVMEQTRLEYDPVRIIDIGAELCKQAARSADAWAAAMEADGVLNPDPRSSRAAAYLCQGDTYAVIGDYERAIKPYQKMVESFPGWAGGYVTLAKTYLAVDNLSAALESFQTAMTWNPAWQGPRADKAAQLAAEGRVEEAIILYEEITD